jgi:hypothetical protein
MNIQTAILIGIICLLSSFIITHFTLDSHSSPSPGIQLHSCQHNMQEYQIRLEMDSAYLYDGNRLVGSCSYEDGDGSGIDSLILKDKL